MENFFKAIISLILTILSLFSCAFVMEKIYYWYMPFILKQFPHFEYSHFITFAVLISTFVSLSNMFNHIKVYLFTNENTNDYNFTLKIATISNIVPWLILGLMYLCKFIVPCQPI